MRPGSLKIALAHDVLINTGGAERVAAVMAGAFPGAPIYTCAYHPEKTFPVFRERDVHTTFLQTLPHREKLVKLSFPFAVPAVESFDLRDFDLVLSSSTFLVKGILTPPGTCHVSYLHNVFRLLWSKNAYEGGRGRRRRSRLLEGLLTPLRLWDFAASQRPDYLLTNSRVVRARIQKHYRRHAEVLHPPVDLSLFQVSPHQDDYFLVVSRLVPYKRIDIAVRAFNRLGRRLLVVGDGSERKGLARVAGKNIEFLGTVRDELLSELYAKAQAVVFPGEEDFGLVPLEALASGRPVIAYKAGGVLETLTGETGVLFSPQTPEALVRAVEEFERRAFVPAKLRAHAEQFGIEKFVYRLRARLESAYAVFTGEKQVPSPEEALVQE
jgi:glycosyltransferase involved in cell wall biosynthesis